MAAVGKKHKTNNKKVKGKPKSDKLDEYFASDFSDDEYSPSKDEISNQIPSEEESDGETESNIESDNESSKIRPGRERGKSQTPHIDPYSNSDISVYDYCAPQQNDDVPVPITKTKTTNGKKTATKKVVQANSDDSDASDGDYCPDGEDGNLPSEIDSDGDDEDNSDEGSSKKQTTKKRGKRQSNGRRKSRKVQVEEEEPEELELPVTTLTEEEEKKRADDLWASFLGDGDTPTTTTTTKVDQKVPKETSKKSMIEPIIEKPIKEKVTVTEIFEFAGEEVKVTKEVLVDTVESRLGSSSKSFDSSPGSQKKGKFPFVGTPRPSGGIGAVLGQLGKKNKIGTLEKSKLDWNSFKSQEGIDEEIQTHNKGKDG